MKFGTKRKSFAAALCVAVMGVVATALPATAQTRVSGGFEGGSSGSGAGAAGPSVETTTVALAPDAPGVLETPAPVVDPAQASVAYTKLLDRRELVAGGVPALRGPAGPAAPLPNGPTTVSGGAATDLLSVPRNTQNSVAKSVAQTLAEPAAAVDDREVIYTGNTFGSRSTDNGNTWTSFSYPAGPTEAPNACCDTDVVHHSPTDTTFHIMLYTNAALTNGNVRIFVRRGSTDTVDCSYTIDPSGSATMMPDYPHIAVSNGYLYLSYQKVDGSSNWVGSDMKRFNVSQMSNCQTTSSNTYTYTGSSQRIIVPAEGATTTMYWGVLDNTTTFRLYKWPESSTSVSSNTYSVAESAFNNPDCRGGTNNYDFIERGTAYSIAGFRMRGAVAGSVVQFVWPSSAVGGATQAHVRGVVVNPSTNTKVQDTIIYNNSTPLCFSFPVLGGNSDGEFAISLAAGGKSGGGGSAAQGYVGVDDSSTSGYWFQTVSLTASGTTNRSDGRFGDYFTIRANERCPRTWVATNFALSGGSTSSANVNARFVQLQSNTEPACAP